MNFSQCSLKKRGTGLILTFLALIFLFPGCGNSSGATGTTGSPVSYTPGAGQVLIRLMEGAGGPVFTVSAVPEWELYGDGTLLYQSPRIRSGNLLQAQLQPTDTRHILDVVVNQDAFFAQTKSFYGKTMPSMRNPVSMLLTVHANKQQQTVVLTDEEGAPSEDQHMFSILHFLQSYQPASSRPYAAPGAIVWVFPDSRPSVVQWPYPDISLQQVRAQESSNSGGYFPIYGKRGGDLLNMLENGDILLVSQEGQTYFVVVWPLLPDNLVVQADGKQWVETNNGRWLLLPGAH